MTFDPRAIRAVGFDLDGTLLDTLPDIAAAANAMLRDIGRPVVAADVVRGYIGDGIGRLTKRLLTGSMDAEPEEGLFATALAAFERHYFAGVSRLTKPFPGVVDALRALHAEGMRMACVTNKAERFTLALLRDQGLADLFAVVLGGDTLPRRKPDPLPLVHCMDRFATSPVEFLYVGDSANDVAAARAAGCQVVCVPYGYAGRHDVRDLGADAIVAGIPDLVRLLT